MDKGEQFEQIKSRKGLAAGTPGGRRHMADHRRLVLTQELPGLRHRALQHLAITGQHRIMGGAGHQDIGFGKQDFSRAVGQGIAHARIIQAGTGRTIRLRIQAPTI